MSIELGEIVLCLGIGISVSERKVHLIRLDDPFCAQTRRWQPGEEFAVGKWYKKQNGQSKYYKPIDDVIQTTVIRQIDTDGLGKTTIELVMPVFFPPDLTSISYAQFGQLPSFANQDAKAIPICPFFGLDGFQYLSPVKWSEANNSMYSGELFGFKMNISYTVGALPEWTSQNIGQLKAWNYNEYPIVKQLCEESRMVGLLVDGITVEMPNMKNINLYLVLSEQAELSIAIFPEPKRINVGEYRYYWPIKLDIYKFPVVIALDCPQNGQNVHSGLKLHLEKLAIDKFELSSPWKENPFNSSKSANSKIPWLGKIIDPHDLLDDLPKKEEEGFSIISIKARLDWNLAKRSVGWIIEDAHIDGTATNNATDQCTVRTNGDEVNKSAATDGLKASIDIDGACKSALPDAHSSMDDNHALIEQSNLAIDANNGLAAKKTTIAAFMTIRWMGGDAVFLFWQDNKFYRKCYGQFHNSVIPLNLEPRNFGKWFELKYLDYPKSQTQIIVFDYIEIDPRAETRVRDEICAQFSTNRDRFMNVWHTIYPCNEKDNYFQDKGWWPWLCQKCFPDLRKLSPPIVGTKTEAVQQENNETKENESSLEYLEKRMRNSLVLEDKNSDNEIRLGSISMGGTSSSLSSSQPISRESPQQNQQQVVVQNQPNCAISPSNTMRMNYAVLLTVRESSGDFVFLFYDEATGKFTYRVYAHPTERVRCEKRELLVGNWYKMEFKLNAGSLQDAQVINVLSIGLVDGPIETRVKNGILAQFKIRPKKLTTWHKHIDKWHPSKAQNDDGQWWPSLCTTCYPPAEAQMPIAKPKTQYTTKHSDNEFTSSDEDNADDESNKGLGFRLKSKTSQKVEVCSPPAISPSRPISSTSSHPFPLPPIPPANLLRSTNNLVRDAESRSPNIFTGAISGALITTTNNSPAESTQNGTEAGKAAPSGAPPALTGQFGSARMRRQRVDANSSTVPPSNVPSTSQQ